MNRIEDILAVCIEDIKTGKATLESCLHRYPEVRDEIEPLLKTALSIQAPPDIEPSQAFKMRTRVQLIENIHAEKSARVSHPSGFHIFNGAFLGSRLARGLAMSLIIIIIVMASGTATAYAAQGSLPGETLYPVKLGTEELRSALAGNDINAVEMELSFAETRLQEIGELADRELQIPASSISRYGEHVITAFKKASENSHNQAVVKLETMSSTMLEQLTLLDTLGDRYPSAAGEICIRCQESAMAGQTESLEALAQLDPVKATEMNILAQQNRLQRAIASVNAGEETKSEIALQQFTRLCNSNQEILQIARTSGHGTAVIDELNVQAGRYQMEALDHINGKVSEDIMKAARRGMWQNIDDTIKESPDSDGDTGTQGTPGKHGNDSMQPGNGQGNQPAENTEVTNKEQSPPVDTTDNPGSASGKNESQNEAGVSPGEPGYGSEEPGNGTDNPPGTADGPGKTTR